MTDRRTAAWRGDIPPSRADILREVRWYLLTLVLLGTIGAVYVWFSEPPVPPPPAIDTTKAAPAIAEALDTAVAEAQAEPRSGRARGRLGMLCLAHDYRREALDCFRQAVRLEPRQFRWRYYLAVVEEDFNLGDAASAYKSALVFRPDYAPLYMRLGNVLMRLNRPEEARKNYLQSSELAPDSPYPLLGLARLEIGLGALEEARELVDQAIAVGPWSRDAAVERIRLLRISGDISEAARQEESAALLTAMPGGMPDEFLNEVDQLDLSSNRMAKLADLLLSQGKFEEAAELLKRLIIDRPDLPRLRLNLGQIRLRQRNIESAIQIFRDTVRQFPNDPTAHFALGTALESNSQFDEAVTEYMAASSRKPDYAEALYREGRVWNKLGQPNRAFVALRSALAADPALVRAHSEIARTLQAMGRRAEAIQAVRNVLRLAPNDSEMRELLQELEGEPATP